MRALDLLGRSRDELGRMVRAGYPIDPRALDDTEYRGTSLGLPSWVERLTWKRFRKAFHRDPQTGALRGWNVRMQQAPEDFEPMSRRGRPRTFGHYVVRSGADLTVPTGCEHGLLLDYGRLRDPLVALAPGDATLLLGWSYLDLGYARIPTPSYFVLELEGPLSYVP